MARLHRITPCLWFDSAAEDAARAYVSIFPNSRIKVITRFGTAGFELHGRPAGSVQVVTFELDGVAMMALNGGPLFRLSEAVSFVVRCDTQAEIDHYWERLADGGDPGAQQCGWLKDRYGLSWQVVPADIEQWMTGPHADAVMTALLPMRKLDLAALRAAAGG